jgi:hypothetical protein
MVGIVLAWARHTAKIRAKSLIGQKKTFSIIAHLCSEMAFFGRKSTFRQVWLIRWYSRTKHAAHSYLGNRTTAHTEYALVELLIFSWNFEYVNSLALRDTHRFKKAKYWNIAHFCSEKRKTSFRWVHPGSLIGLIQKEEWSKWKPKYMESNCWPQLRSLGWFSWKFGQFLSI